MPNNSANITICGESQYFTPEVTSRKEDERNNPWHLKSGEFNTATNKAI